MGTLPRNGLSSGAAASRLLCKPLVRLAVEN